MTKTYCDICGREMVPGGGGIYGSYSRPRNGPFWELKFTDMCRDCCDICYKIDLDKLIREEIEKRRAEVKQVTGEAFCV